MAHLARKTAATMNYGQKLNAITEFEQLTHEFKFLVVAIYAGSSVTLAICQYPGAEGCHH